MTRRIAVLISGRGSNLQSIIDAVSNGTLPATIAVVVSNKREAPGLARAAAAGIETLFVNPKDHQGRMAYDEALVDQLRRRRVDLVCFAGFMRIVGRPFLDAYPGRMLNIHPSLLPSFPGLDAQQQALDHGVRVSGATVHFVTAGLDDGPIVSQGVVPVFERDTVDTLSVRILEEEHRLYPEAIRIVLDGNWRLDGRRVMRRA